MFSGEHNLIFVVFPLDLVVGMSGEGIMFGRVFTGAVKQTGTGSGTTELDDGSGSVLFENT